MTVDREIHQYTIAGQACGRAKRVRSVQFALGESLADFRRQGVSDQRIQRPLTQVSEFDPEGG